jgi:hypothetical protein
VAVHIARSEVNLIGSGAVIALVMIYGAAGFYLGIDLPPPPEKLRELPLRKLGSKADAVKLLSAAGTFLTAIAAVIAVTSIIVDEVARPGGAVAVFLAWLIGLSMQIAAGIIARSRAGFCRSDFRGFSHCPLSENAMPALGGEYRHSRPGHRADMPFSKYRPILSPWLGQVSVGLEPSNLMLVDCYFC